MLPFPSNKLGCVVSEEFITVEMPEVSLTQEEAELILFRLFYGEDKGEYSPVWEITLVKAGTPPEDAAKIVKALETVPGFDTILTTAQSGDNTHSSLTSFRLKKTEEKVESVTLTFNPVSDDQKAALKAIADKMEAARVFPTPLSAEVMKINRERPKKWAGEEGERKTREARARHFVPPLTDIYNRIAGDSAGSKTSADAVKGQFKVEIERVAKERGLELNETAIAAAVDTLFTTLLAHQLQVLRGASVDGMRPAFQKAADAAIRAAISTSRALSNGGKGSPLDVFRY